MLWHGKYLLILAIKQLILINLIYYLWYTENVLIGRDIELQIRRGTENNSKIIFLFLTENKCCDPSLEPFRRDGSNGGSQNMFLCRDMADYP